MPETPADHENPYAPPAVAVDTATLAERDGQRVRFAGADKLPRICLRCGEKKGAKRRPETLQWIPRETYLALPLGLLPYMVLRMIFLKAATVQLPLCEPCDAIWRGAGLARGGLIVAATVAGLVTLIIVSNDAPVAGVIFGLGSAGGLLLAMRRFLPPKRLRVRRIEAGGVVTLDGVHHAAAETIEAMHVDQ